MKLKTKIEHKFNIDDELLEDLDFTIKTPAKIIKAKIKITEIKQKNFRKDASTRLF